MTRSRIKGIVKEAIAPFLGVHYEEPIRSDVSEPITSVFEKCLRHFLECHVNRPSSSAVHIAEEDTKVVYIEDQPLQVLPDGSIEYDETEEELHDRIRFWVEVNGRILVQWSQISIRIYPDGHEDMEEYGTRDGVRSASLSDILQITKICGMLKEMGFTGIHFLSDMQMREHESDEYNIGRPVNCRFGASREKTSDGVWLDEAYLVDEMGREIHSIWELFVPEYWSLDELQTVVEGMKAS